MILKRENNFIDRVNDPISKGKKVLRLTPIKFDSEMAQKRKGISLIFLPNICVRLLNLERSL